MSASGHLMKEGPGRALLLLVWWGWEVAWGRVTEATAEVPDAF